MKGKHLAIGLILFVIAAIIAIYFAMNATFKKDMDSQIDVINVESVDN